MELTSVAQEWENYARFIFDGMEDLSEVQYEETKRAFFAGATTVSFQLVHIAHNDDITADEGNEHLKSIFFECKKFHEDFKRELTEQDERDDATLKTELAALKEFLDNRVEGITEITIKIVDPAEGEEN